MRAHLVTTALLGLVLGSLGLSAWSALSLPVVYESWSRRECVRVDDPEGVHSCENPPVKFVHEWVQ